MPQETKSAQNFFDSKIPNVVIYTFFLILGIYFNDYGFSSTNLILIGLFVSGIILVWLRYILEKKSEFYNLIGISLICFFAGSVRNQHVVSDYDNKINILAYKKLELYAKVLDVTKFKQKNMPYKLSLEIQDLSENIAQAGYIKTDTKNFDAYKNKIIYIYTKTDPNLKIGDKIKLKDIELKKSDNKEFKRYLIKEEILSNLFILNLESKITKLTEITETNFPEKQKNLSWYDKITVFKNKLIKKIENKLSPKSFAYFSLVFFGYKNISEDIFTQVKKDFSYWGLSHYIARAGLHLLMVILILQILTAFMPISYSAKKILSIILITIYAVLSWSTIGFLRSLIMFFIYNLCNFLYLPVQAINIVSLTCFMVLLHNPSQLFFLDFQLSFGITFALALYNILKV